MWRSSVCVDAIVSRVPSELTHRDHETKPSGPPPQPAIESHEPATEQLCQRHVFGVIGLRPAELLCDPPCLAAKSSRVLPAHGYLFNECQQLATHLGRDFAPPNCLVDGGARLRPHQGRGHQLFASESLEAVRHRALDDYDVRVEDERQCPSRDRRIQRTTFGIGSPHHVVFHPSGSGSISSSSASAVSRSVSSITCCVPILRARSLPERIHRRIVSGFRPRRLAASGTVSIVVIYYYTPLGAAADPLL